MVLRKVLSQQVQVKGTVGLLVNFKFIDWFADLIIFISNYVKLIEALYVAYLFLLFFVKEVFSIGIGNFSFFLATILVGSDTIVDVVNILFVFGPREYLFLLDLTNARI